MTSSREVVYRDGYLTVHVEMVTTSGRSAPFSTASLGRGVVVVAIGSDRTVYLVEEFRRAYGRRSLECIGGRVETGESTEQAARRELREETGIEASSWMSLGEFWPHTSKITATASLWLATGLVFGPPAPDPGEQIRLVPTLLPDALSMVRKNLIVNASSALALLLAASHV